ncbi:hypothetical protein HDV03_002990 [Kappamyces sp. JEL0829]|nr:hypothetical protein HDV03_002990 [Kappamyces sp. JEL0829]
MNVIEYLDELFVPSLLFSILHSIQNAYTVRKTSPPTCNLFRMIVATVVLSMGGGIVTNFLLARPQIVFFSPKILPVYCTAAFLFFHFPHLYSAVDSLPPQSRSRYFYLIDALSRGYALPKFLQGLRAMEAPIKCSLPGQFVLGTLSITGGGLCYAWFFQNQPWKMGGWVFTIITLVTILNIFAFQVVDARPYSSILYEIKVWLEMYNLLPGLPELKATSALCIFVGLVTQPGPAPRYAKPETEPMPVPEPEPEPVPETETEDTVPMSAKAPEKPIPETDKPTTRRRRASSKKDQDAPKPAPRSASPRRRSRKKSFN